MQRAQVGNTAAVPQFFGDEIAHLQAYIRMEGIRTDRRVVLFPLPDPRKGASLFESKRCDSCHDRGSGRGPDLKSKNMNLSVSQIGAILWNHSYEMFASMRVAGIPTPKFEGNEMADLISYLHFIGFFSEEGDSERGAGVFQQRGCAQCHGSDEGGAPDLAESDVSTDSISLSAAMWNHAPDMHELMAERAVPWPQFGPGEMEDLSAYLRALGRPAP